MTEEEDAYEAEDDPDPRPPKRIRYSVGVEHPIAFNHQLDDTVSLGYRSGSRLGLSSPLTNIDDFREDLPFFPDNENPQTPLGTHLNELSVTETQGDLSYHLNTIMGPLNQALDEVPLDRILEDAESLRHRLEQTSKSFEEATVSASIAQTEAEAAGINMGETRETYRVLLCQAGEEELAAQLRLVQYAKLRMDTATKSVEAAQLEEMKARQAAARVREFWEELSLVFLCPNASGSSQAAARVRELWKELSLIFLCPNASKSSQGGI